MNFLTKNHRGANARSIQAPHIHDSISLRRHSTIMFLALLPCVVFGIWNCGYQANSALQESGIYFLEGWRGSILEWLNVNLDAGDQYANVIHGVSYFLPLLLVTATLAYFWEFLFARLRATEMHEGCFLLALMFSLTLPATIPLWQAALGITFAVVIGKEVFGGTGMNIVHPVLAGRAFLYFAYPDRITSDGIWSSVDGISGATALSILKNSGVETLLSSDTSWVMAFLGKIPGSLGETSTLACLLGASLLLLTGLISWRVVLAVCTGMILTSTLFNIIGSDSNPMFATPWYWHAVLGGFAFATIFLATDPTTSANTNTGRWFYGLLIGVLVIIIRVTNPVAPEGIMFAILLANIAAPLIDYTVMQFYIRRRRRNRVTQDSG